MPDHDDSLGGQTKGSTKTLLKTRANDAVVEFNQGLR